jgi:hypothetical protein
LEAHQQEDYPMLTLHNSRELTTFLLACLRDVILLEEGTPHEALTCEIRRIDAAIAQSGHSPAAMWTFQLMREFFVRVKAKTPKSKTDMAFLYTVGPATYAEIYNEIKGVCDARQLEAEAEAMLASA